MKVRNTIRAIAALPEYFRWRRIERMQAAQSGRKLPGWWNAFGAYWRLVHAVAMQARFSHRYNAAIPLNITRKSDILLM